MRYWVKNRIEEPEKIILFESRGKKVFKLASNFPYEVFFDGKFTGSGGQRCPNKIVYADEWDASQVSKVRIKLHFLSHKNSVWYRCIFTDPFFEDVNNNGKWNCLEDLSINFGEKINCQLPRQNIIRGFGTKPLKIESVLREKWTTVNNPISRPKYEAILPKIIRNDDNVISYDLGKIALHKVEMRELEGKTIVYYSEISSYEKIYSSKNRSKVRLIDYFNNKGMIFGERGCRYLHIIGSKRFRLKIWRRIYPLIWKDEISNSPIIEAVKSNLIACVDGGVVDTCWRERAQWVGDLRMSAIALEKLTINGLKIVEHCLSQIATSYDEKTAMIQGCWPTKWPWYKGCLIPTYHLAFCLTVARHSRSEKLKKLSKKSLERWRELYADSDGLLYNVPGWHFVDWDFDNQEVVGRNIIDQDNKIIERYHSVLNAWYYEACKVFRMQAPFSIEKFNGKFMVTDGVYSILENSNRNIHATAVAIGSLPINSTKGIEFINSQNLSAHATKYFGYFIAKALSKGRKESLDKFITNFYLPVAKKYNTIYEKINDSSSLAHSWSVGIIDYLL